MHPETLLEFRVIKNEEIEGLNYYLGGDICEEVFNVILNNLKMSNLTINQSLSGLGVDICEEFFNVMPLFFEEL